MLCMTRIRHAAGAQDGWTLIECMVGLALALTVAGSSLMLLNTSLHSQKETGSRLVAQDDGSFAMLRLTKDIRAATAATVQDARTLDLAVPEEISGTLTTMHVRYSCTGSGGTGACWRYVCSTPYNASACPSWSHGTKIAGGVANSDNFRGLSQGANQSYPSHTPSTWAGTGSAAADNIGFVAVHIKVARSEDKGIGGTGLPLDFHDGADLSNFTN